MKQVTFITGNQDKADYLARLIGMRVNHHKVDLDEIQSVDLCEVVEHKVRQAYDLLKTPVLVEDVSLAFVALNGLPGTFIKFFVEYTGLEATCRILDGFSNRTAIAKCTYGYYDGENLSLFEGVLHGEVTKEPAKGTIGYGWDRIFAPEGYDGTARSELTQEDYDKTYLQVKPIEELKKFLTS